ncbi:MAG: hypothetical protein Q9170_001083 [Blastenia crenularia]
MSGTFSPSAGGSPWDGQYVDANRQRYRVFANLQDSPDYKPSAEGSQTRCQNSHTARTSVNNAGAELHGRESIPSSSEQDASETGPSTSCRGGNTVEDLFSTTIAGELPPSVARIDRLRSCEEEAAGLNKATLELHFAGPLHESMNDLISGTIEATRRAYEVRIREEVKTSWRTIIQKWLEDQLDQQRRDIMAKFHEQYKQQWLAENTPTLLKDLTDRAEAAYHKFRTEREAEADRRWAKQDFADYMNQKRNQVQYQIEADLRQELERGVVAALKTEHMERLREEARHQITNEMMESMREEARREIIDDHARYQKNIRWAPYTSSTLSVDAPARVSGNSLFSIYSPGLAASSESRNIPQPTRVSSRVTVHSAPGQSPRMAGKASQSRPRPSLAAAFDFKQPSTKQASAEGDMPPPPKPGSIVPGLRDQSCYFTPAVLQAQNSSSRLQHSLLNSPVAEFVVAEEASKKQTNSKVLETRLLDPVRGNGPGPSSLKIDQTRSGDAGSAVTETQSDNVRHEDVQIQEHVQSGQGQHIASATRIIVVPPQKGSNKRARSRDNEVDDESAGKNEEIGQYEANEPVNKRTRVEPSSQNAGQVTQTRAHVRRAAAAKTRAGASARSNASTMTAAAPPPPPAAATSGRSAAQSSQSAAAESEKSSTSSTPMKQRRGPQESVVKEGDDLESPPLAKRTRAGIKISAARNATAKCEKITAAAAINAEQKKRKPERPPKGERQSFRPSSGEEGI